MIAEREAFHRSWGETFTLQILTQNRPFPTAIPRFAQHNQITVTSDTYIAALKGMRGRISFFKQCIQHLAIPAAALYSEKGFCGLLTWLLALLVSRGSTILRRLRPH